MFNSFFFKRALQEDQAGNFYTSNTVTSPFEALAVYRGGMGALTVQAFDNYIGTRKLSATIV